MIRRITEQDREIYIELATEFYETDAVLKNVDSKNFAITFDELMRSDDYAEGYIIEVDGKIVGYGLTAKTFTQEAGGMVLWLEELYLRPDYRSIGLGNEFLSLMLARKNEFKRIRLEVESDNIRAVKLYKSLGFCQLNYDQMMLGE